MKLFQAFGLLTMLAAAVLCAHRTADASTLLFDQDVTPDIALGSGEWTVDQRKESLPGLLGIEHAALLISRTENLFVCSMGKSYGLANLCCFAIAANFDLDNFSGLTLAEAKTHETPALDANPEGHASFITRSVVSLFHAESIVSVLSDTRLQGQHMPSLVTQVSNKPRLHDTRMLAKSTWSTGLGDALLFGANDAFSRRE